MRHEVVHNPFVIAELAAKGAIFVDELDAVPDGAPVVFSAHGVAKSVRAEAERRRLLYIDATCPLVTKVHREVERHVAARRQVILIGHRGHPEVIGTVGQADSDEGILVQSAAEAVALPIDEAKAYGLAMQTTLSIRDTREIAQVLRDRIPRLQEPPTSDICYATSNRQAALAAVAPRCEAVVVIGGANSANSRRLVETAQSAGCRNAVLIGRAGELDLSVLDGIGTLSATSGASTPEILMAELVEYLSRRFALDIKEIVSATEATRFNLPRLPDRNARSGSGHREGAPVL